MEKQTIDALRYFVEMKQAYNTYTFRLTRIEAADVLALIEEIRYLISEVERLTTLISELEN